MKDGKVHPVGGISPRYLLSRAVEELNDIDTLVMFRKNRDGVITLDASDGTTLGDMSFCAVKLMGVVNKMAFAEDKKR